MNCVDGAVRYAEARGGALALWVLGGGAQGRITFSQLLDRAACAQQALRRSGVGQGDTILILDSVGPRLYATVLAVLSLGAAVVLVEPWMPIKKIDRAIRLARPSLFVANSMGLIWGSRVRSIREIRGWLPAAQLDRISRSAPLHVESVDPNLPAILTFTSGTTGDPKGIIRHQGYLAKQYEVLSAALGHERFTGPDLCVFANFVLLNLAAGRGSVLVPPRWRAVHIRSVDRLPEDLQPETLTCGPGFLRKLIRHADIASLRSVHVGGALVDCELFDQAFARWPAARWLHMYGSTEVEPVTVCDARTAVRKSRERDYFQTLYLGQPVTAIESALEEDDVWVTGPHVSPRYLGDVEANRLHKRVDATGRVWHSMGDRIRILDPDDGGWWYSGRSSQLLEDFELEQRIYTKLRSSKAFLHRRADGELILVGEGLSSLALQTDDELGTISRIVEAKICRDRRHRARIDRARTLAKGPRWLRG